MSRLFSPIILNSSCLQFARDTRAQEFVYPRSVRDEFLIFASGLLLTLLCVNVAWGAEYHVNNAAELTSAMSNAVASADNDTIYLNSGTYSGSFAYSVSSSYSSGNILVRSEPGKDPKDVIIKAGGAARGLLVHSTLLSAGACPTVTVQGITVRGAAGMGSLDAGISVRSSSVYGSCTVQVLDCIVMENARGIYIGGNGTLIVRGNDVWGNLYSGIEAYPTLTTNLRVQNNVVQKNGASASGGGTGLYFYSNTAGSVSADIVNNSILRNRKFGLWVQNESSSGVIRVNNNLFFENGDGFNGDDIYLEKYHPYGQPETLPGTYQSGYNNYTRVLTGTSGSGVPAAATIFNGGETAKSSGDPQFVAIGPKNYVDLGYSYNFLPVFGSPAVDSGNNGAGSLPSTDKAGNTRITDGDGNGVAVVERGAYERGVYVNPDKDSDGILNEVDGYMGNGFIDQSGLSSSRFSDQGTPSGGVTFGEIVSRGAMTLTIADASSPLGVSVESQGGSGASALIKLCNFVPPMEMSLSGGDHAVLTCGSLQADVITGPVEFVSGLLTVSVPAATSVMLAQDPLGFINIRNDEQSSGAVTVTGPGGVSQIAPDDERKVAPAPDTDNDGYLDNVDECPADAGKVVPGTCGCGVADNDSDNDGTPDCQDQCPGDPSKVVSGQCGCGVMELDSDGDQTPDCVDGCAEDASKVAPGQCGCGNPDVDNDEDGVANCQDLCANDGGKVTPGVCGCGVSDIDSDGDGTADCLDLCPGDPAKTSPGVCGCEVRDTVCGCGIADTDHNKNDKLDCQEDCNLNLIPDLCDVASDRFPALCQNVCILPALRTMPLCGGSMDCNNNLVPDSCELVGQDCDQNGQLDSCQKDQDKDGVIDACDGCGSDKQKTEPGICGCGVSDRDSDEDGIMDCKDLCPVDSRKSAPGVCGCGKLDEDKNANGVTDCLEPDEQCLGACDPQALDNDEDGDGVTNCREIDDETDPCDPGSVLVQLLNWACAGPNSFFGQINISTVVNHQETPLKVRAVYRDWMGKAYPAWSHTLNGREKWDIIVNEMGLVPDSYGTFCVYTDASSAGSWSGGLAVYKVRERAASAGPNSNESASFDKFSDFDYALYYPFSAPRRGIAVVSLNTHAINLEGEVAAWVRLLDGSPGDGRGLRGKLRFYDSEGGVVGMQSVSIPDGGRFDYSGHGALGQRAIGTAVFEPQTANEAYFIEASRYHYEEDIQSGVERFFTAYAIPVLASTGANVSGRILSAGQQIGIVEVLNSGASKNHGQFTLFSSAGTGLVSLDVGLPGNGARHLVLGSGALNISGQEATSFALQAAHGSLSAVNVVYSFNEGYEYAYAPSLSVARHRVQWSEYNTYLGQTNRLVLSNAGDNTVENIQIQVFTREGDLLQELLTTLSARQTTAFVLDKLPENTYGAIRVESPGKEVAIQNEISKKGEYVLIFPGVG